MINPSNNGVLGLLEAAKELFVEYGVEPHWCGSEDCEASRQTGLFFDALLNLIESTCLAVIGEDFKHSNGKKMVNPSYECPECGVPDPDWTINKVMQSQRATLAKLIGKEE